MKIPQAIIFIPVPSKNPFKEPKAAVKALFESELSWIISPTQAPIKGPAIIPSGPTKKPIINPIVEPQVPALLPPDCFVKMIGKILVMI